MDVRVKVVSSIDAECCRCLPKTRARNLCKYFEASIRLFYILIEIKLYATRDTLFFAVHPMYAVYPFHFYINTTLTMYDKYNFRVDFSNTSILEILSIVDIKIIVILHQSTVIKCQECTHFRVIAKLCVFLKERCN